MNKAGIFFIKLLALLSILFSLIPLLTAEEWYVRVFDFPRLQVFFMALASLLLYYIFIFHKRKRGWLLLAALIGVMVYQSYNIYPYTFLAPQQVEYSDAPEPDPRAQLSVLVANVLMHNHDFQQFITLVGSRKADMVLTLESDSLWEEQLAVLETDYPHTIKIPKSNTYGMHLYSKLPLRDTKIMYWLDMDIPSLKTYVQLHNGRWVEFHGVHPKPPVPGEAGDSRRRDAEIVIVANRVSKSDYPVVVAGDFNDVAWSKTTLLFQQVSGLLDPRIGRGFYNTFHAGYPLFRWPLDHVFVSPHFTLREMQVLPDIGSDHFPVYINLSFEPGEQGEQPVVAPEEDTAEEATQTINEGIEDAKKPEEDPGQQ